MEKVIGTTVIPMSQLQPNEGQIPGVPRNPRTLTEDDFENLVRSLQEDPDMAYYRELEVWQMGQIFVVLGGNMRLRAMERLEYKEAPCKVIPPETTVEELRRYVVKDNLSYGEWDKDALAEQWAQYDLSSFGIDMPDENKGEEPKEEGESTQDLTFTLSPDEFKYVKQELNKVDKDNAKALVKILMEYGG